MELSVHEAADRLGISEATVRRRIRKGELRAVKRPIPTGYEWRVIIGDQPPVITVEQDVITTDQPRESHQHADNAAVAQSTVNHADQGIVTADQGVISTNAVPYAAFERILEDNRRLQDENVQLAGQVGYLQRQVLELQEQVRMLTMEKEPEEETRAPQPESEPPSEPRSPLWQWVRRKLSRT